MASNHIRVILHIDLDCFYCQVEQRRLAIPREKPVAVQQWEGLIAINYAARAAGITRHMRVTEAKQKCPELICCHVQTLGDSGQQGGTEGPPPQKDRSMQKACLERYRQASMQIMLLLRSLVPQAVIEKASIDEVYIDVTSLVDSEIQAREASEGWQAQSVDAFAWGSIVLGELPLAVDSEFDRRLSVGAAIACRLRGAVLDQLGYTCSAGIACNKLLAKIASAMNKPNQQTIVPPRAVPALMKDLPLKKLRNFGGKLGEQLGGLGCTTAGEVSALPIATLEGAFGRERTLSILEAVAGRSTEAVEVKDKPQSMLAAKSFEPTSDMAAIARWFGILAEELAARMAGDYELHQRRPRNLVVHYRTTFKGGGERSRSAVMPRAPPKGTPGAAAVAEAASAIFKRIIDGGDGLPTSRLAISARDFVDAPHNEKEDSIMHFFGSGSTAEPPSPGRRPSAPAAPPPPPKNTIKSMFSKAKGRDDKAGTKQPQTAEPSPTALHRGQAADGGSESHRPCSSDSHAASEPPAPLHASSKPKSDEASLNHNHQPTSSPAGPAVQPHQSGADGADAMHGRQPMRDPRLPEATVPPPDAMMEEGDGAAASASRVQSATGAGLNGVSVEEQKRILRDIWLQSQRQHARPHHASNDSTDPTSKRQRLSSAPSDGKPPKQMRISSLFSKKT